MASGSKNLKVTDNENKMTQRKLDFGGGNKTKQTKKKALD